MPKKLQIKLLSQTAELLSITNCTAGQISVLRAEAQSELRPYQRALSGNQGRERFVITVDGAEYKTEDHNLIGFGEIPPHSGLTVSQYLSSVGLIDGAITGLLVSFGIEGIEQKACSALSPDEERKIRLFAAAADPTKALVINEPFEPLMSSWRERLAEFLSDFARTKNGLVVITSLSYRPDSWIDNPIISRHQVGQSLRRTIGFGSAGSEDSQLINQLRDQIRADTNAPAAQRPEPAPRTQAAAMSLGAAALMGSESIKPGVEQQMLEDSSPRTSFMSIPTAIKASAGVGAAGLGIWAALSLLGVLPGKQLDKPPTPEPIVMQQELQPHTGQPAANAPADPQGSHSGATARVGPASDIPVSSFILDHYANSIRVSLLDTAKGSLGEAAIPEAPVALAKAPENSNGNFYKLLESASTDKSESGAREQGWQQQEDLGSWNEPKNSEPDPDFNAAEEEERREAIREKFLDAIRAAAERREQEGTE